MQPRGLSALDPSLRAAKYARTSAASAKPIAQTGHGGLDWVPSLVGTLGGIGGGALGTLAAPGVGTALGGFGGAAAGQALGQRLEDMLTGHQTTGGELAGAAGLGAGGMLLGGAIGKGVGALASRLPGVRQGVAGAASKLGLGALNRTLGGGSEAGFIGLGENLSPAALKAGSSKALSSFDRADSALAKTLGQPKTPKINEDLNINDAAAQFGRDAGITAKRPAHQLQIEKLMNGGDKQGAMRLAQSLPDSDPYKASMVDMLTRLGVKPELGSLARAAQGSQTAINRFDQADKGLSATLKGFGDESGSIGFNEPLGAKTGLGSIRPQTGAEIADEAVLSRSLAGRAGQKQGLLLAQQYGTIPKKIADRTDPIKTFQNLSKIGLTKPADVEAVSKGAIKLVDNAVSKAVGTARRVPIEGTSGKFGLPPIRDSIADAIESNGVVGNDAKSMLGVINGQLKILAGAGKGTLKPGANATDTMQVIRELESRSASLSGKAYSTTGSPEAAENMAAAYRQIADELKDRLFLGIGGANSNVAKVLTPELRQQLLSLAPENAKWVTKVNEVMAQKDIPGLRTAIKDLTRGKIIIEAADRNAMTYGARAAQNLPVTMGSLIRGAVNSEPVRQAEAKVLENVAALPGAAKAASVPQLAKDVVKRIGRGVVRMPAMSEGLPAVGYQAGSLLARGPQQPAEAAGLGGLQPPQDMASQYAQDPTNPQFLGVDPAQFGYPEDMTAQPPGASGPSGLGGLDQGITPDLIQNMSMQVLQNSQTMEELMQGLSVISTLSKLMPEESATKPINTNTQKEMIKLNSAQTVADKIASQFASLGDVGRISGRVQGIGGALGINAKAKVYEDFRKSALANIAKSIGGETGVLTDQDIKRVEGMIPKLTDTEDEAAMKLQNLYDLIDSRRQSIMDISSAAGTAPANSYEDAFSQYDLSSL